MNGHKGVHEGGLMRAGLPFEQAALAQVGPAVVLTPVSDSAICSETVFLLRYWEGLGWVAVE